MVSGDGIVPAARPLEDYTLAPGGAAKLAAAASLIPAPSQHPGLNAGYPQTYGSQPIVCAGRHLRLRSVAAQRQFGLAQALYQRQRGLAETDRKRSGWTVNPSANAYAGSNPAPATSHPPPCHVSGTSTTARSIERMHRPLRSRQPCAPGRSTFRHEIDMHSDRYRE